MPVDLRPSQTAQPPLVLLLLRHAVLDRDPHEAEYWEPGLAEVYSQRGCIGHVPSSKGININYLLNLISLI